MSGAHTTTLPTTLAAWEAALVVQHLRIGEDDDASPCRSFEVTPETLAATFPDVAGSAAQAEAAFRTAICSDRFIWGALRDGLHQPATTTVPNCFAYLAMSLLIDTLMDGEYSDQGQFRERLRAWLGTTRSMMQLSGVARMWRELTVWLDARIAAGEPFRKLVLPDPRSWTQIGYTRRLSFPTRSDIRFLERVLANFPRGPSEPAGLIRAIEARISHGGASWGMEAAFEDFRNAFRGGGASSEHRFWRIVQRAARISDQNYHGAEVALEMDFDEDGRRTFRIGTTDTPVPLDIPNLGVAMRLPLLAESTNLAAAATRGVVFFRQIGVARWCAQAEPLNVGRIHLALSPVHAHWVSSAQVDIQPSGDWLISTTPVTQWTVDELLGHLQLNQLRDERLVNFALKGGVRTNGSWLGRPAFLPRIDAADRKVSVRRLARQQSGGTITVVDGELRATEPVEGLYEVSVASHDNADIQEWTRRAQFHRNAVPHSSIGGAAECEPEVREWRLHEPASKSFSPPALLDWDDEEGPVSDLLEALYAAGRSGMPESEIVYLISRGVAGRADPWSVLRSIQEAGFVNARSRTRWRGRVWTLGQAKLESIGGMVVVAGATCVALEREFREVVTALGGIAFRHVGPSQWTPALIGACSINAADLAARMGWELATTEASPRFRPGGLETSQLIAEHHVLASNWDWKKRRFVTGSVGPCEVSLSRWVHPGERDHDVFRVRSSGFNSDHATRNAAILTAHMAAGVPLFAVNDAKVMRTAQEGALPLEIARWLRLKALAGGGPLKDGAYVYPLGTVAPEMLARALPGCIEGVDGSAFGSAPEVGVAAMLAARRSGGRLRLHWIEGTVAVDQ